MPASGADLEMAVEVAPNVWVDLLLQAKRIYPNSTYREWKQSQIDKLRYWAFLNNRTPGMLLYNAEIPPFGAPQTEVELGGMLPSLRSLLGSRLATIAKDWTMVSTKRKITLGHHIGHPPGLQPAIPIRSTWRQVADGGSQQVRISTGVHILPVPHNKARKGDRQPAA